MQRTLVLTAIAVLAAAPSSTASQGAFGPQTQVSWVYAAAFRPFYPDSTWAHLAEGFWYQPSPGVGGFEAQLNLPGGAIIESFECLFYDNSPLDMNALLVKRAFDRDTATPQTFNLVSLQTFGTPGFTLPSVDNVNHLVTYRQGSVHSAYAVVVNFGLNNNSANSRFWGCNVRWRRSVSTAPGIATFADVPVGSPLHPFVEALAASGISGGCGAGNYCPDAPLTRGQMAVFLAAALGLHWPN